jgi:TatD DNase family protein
MFTDSHCHLDPDVYGGDAGVDAAVARAIEAGVTRMVTIGSGYDLPCMARARAVAERHHEVWFTVGVHPHDAKHWSDDVRDAIVAFSSHAKCVAIGEMGLDFHYDNSPRPAQREAFRAQIRLSMELRKPIVIHDRDSEGECFRILVEERAFPVQGGPGVLYHCYTGDVVQMQEITEHGGYVSIPGIVTFNSAAMMREVAKATPLDKLLVETDSPFLTPVPFRGKQNEPARVTHVAEKVAALREVPVAVIASATSANTARFFGFPDLP